MSHKTRLVIDLETKRGRKNHLFRAHRNTQRFVLNTSLVQFNHISF